MAYASRQGRARVSSSSPQAAGQCDRCGFLYTHSTLNWQYDWRGSTMQNLRLLVCRNCLDEPQAQLRAIVVPADPMPIQNPRVPDYVTAETNTRYTQPTQSIGWVNNYNSQINWVNNLNNQINWFNISLSIDPITGIPVPGGDVRITQDDNTRVTQQTGEPPGGLNQEPGTNPDVPGNNDPGLPYNNTDVPKTGPLNE